MHPFDDDTICDSRLKPRVNLFGSLPTTDTPPGLRIVVLELMVTLRVGIMESRPGDSLVEGRRLGGRDPRLDSRRTITLESCQWGPGSLRERAPEVRRDSWHEIRLSPEPFVEDSLLKRQVCWDKKSPGEVDGLEFSEGGIQIGFDSSAQTSTIEFSMASSFNKDPKIARTPQYQGFADQKMFYLGYYFFNSILLSV